MILAMSSQAARATRHEGVLYNGARYWRTDLLGHRASDPETPQAYLIEQHPGSVVPPHFHETNQFQVVVKGTGKLGRHRLGAYSIHFAGGHTAYGPIHASPEGLFYFTFRARSDPGARFLPASKDKLKPVGRRNRLAEVPPGMPADRTSEGEPAETAPAEPATEPTSVLAPVLTPVLEREEDGLAAWKLQLAPNAGFSGPHPREGGGQYYLVLEGSLLHNGSDLPPWSCLFASSGEESLQLTAGPAGLDALILQFPEMEAAAR